MCYGNFLHFSAKNATFQRLSCARGRAPHHCRSIPSRTAAPRDRSTGCAIVEGPPRWRNEWAGLKTFSFALNRRARRPPRAARAAGYRRCRGNAARSRRAGSSWCTSTTPGCLFPSMVRCNALDMDVDLERLLSAAGSTISSYLDAVAEGAEAPFP